ncbi:hypothetical protein LCGC14_0360420 [marine sediment metagenome]|uniref:Uncharacterized protein n=1 Tax=marine sediment metagenome TaxID=412755 RepID=A0A0F9WGJ7_9ZZZZ|nr:hypothetical protein [bacterium]
MKILINFNHFCDRFRSMGRNDNFSYGGKKALFEYLEQYEEECGLEIELDIIAICCEYCEYENLAEFQKDYTDDYQTIEDIENDTIVIRIDDESFLIACF